MSKKNLFALFTILTIFNHQYIHGGKKEILRELLLEMQLLLDEGEKLQGVTSISMRECLEKQKKALLAKKPIIERILAQLVQEDKGGDGTKVCDKCKGTFA